MDKITVRLDMDDVINDLSSHWAETHLSATGEQLELTHWDVHTISKYGKEVYDYFEQEDFFYSCPIKDGALSTIRLLEKSPHVFDYKIVSSCRQEDSIFEYINQQKLQFCKEYLTDTAVMNFVLTGEDKSEFKADVIVDDRPDNLVKQKGGGNPSIRVLFTAPHNKEISLDELEEMNNEKNTYFVRVDNHKQLQDIFNEILKAQSIENYLDNA